MNESSHIPQASPPICAGPAPVTPGEACCAGLLREWYVWVVLVAMAAFGFWRFFAGPPEPAHKTANSIGVEFVYVPPGAFVMGDVRGSRRDGKPQAEPHRVTITRGFYIGRTEVTQSQWTALMGDDPGSAKIADPSTFKGDDLPVHNVTWREAEEFCKRLSRKEGKTYRLPTEAEWEFACRAGADREAPYSGITSGKAPQPVGKRPANHWGVCDMIGNVAEWCADKYAAYAEADAVDPFIAAASEDEPRVVRGGSFRSAEGRGSASEPRPGARAAMSPDDRSDAVGFRIVREK